VRARRRLDLAFRDSLSIQEDQIGGADGPDEDELWLRCVENGGHADTRASAHVACRAETPIAVNIAPARRARPRWRPWKVPQVPREALSTSGPSPPERRNRGRLFARSRTLGSCSSSPSPAPARRARAPLRAGSRLGRESQGGGREIQAHAVLHNAEADGVSLLPPTLGVVALQIAPEDRPRRVDRSGTSGGSSSTESIAPLVGFRAGHYE
jgi:hypothetical protein